MSERRSFVEELTSGVTIALRMEQVLVEETTKFQDIGIFENKALGRVMTIDEGLQLSTVGEPIYHEFMAHVPMLAHGFVERVLIIGGGDGGTAREVLKHKSIREVVLVDIDARVVELCRTYLPNVSHGAYDDSRLDLRIGDGAEAIKGMSNEFDVIIIDAADPDDGASETLFTAEFFGYCKAALRDKGVLVSQGGCPFFEPYMSQGMVARLSKVFGDDVGLYAQSAPDYFGGVHVYIWAGKGVDLAQCRLEVLEQREAQAALQTQEYSAEAHVGAFMLTKSLRALITNGKKGVGADVVSLAEGGDFDRDANISSAALGSNK